jgi:Putative restriction endonuclease
VTTPSSLGYDSRQLLLTEARNTTNASQHRFVVSLLMRLASRIEAFGAHLELQSPITFAPKNEPEPDGMIVRGRLEDYADRHPAPEDVSCVIEVAESSLKRDRTTKQRIYATASIPQYLILNLVDRQIEVREDPQASIGRYRTARVLGREERISLQLPGGQVLEVPGAELLP